MTESLQEVAFLDVLVSRTQTGFKTRIYTKPTDRNQLLLYDSHHPIGVKKSIPISQFSRKVQCRESGQKIHTKKNKQRVAFVSQYNAYSNDCKSILYKHWHLLREAYPTIKEFQQIPMMSFRRGTTIGNKVVSADIRLPPMKETFLGPKRQGMFKCKGCAQCKYVLVGSEFSDTENKKNYKIRGFHTCDTNFVVYMLVCPCGLIYVGETTQKVRDRFSQHRSTIKVKNRSLPVSRHCIDMGHTSDDLKFRVIQHIPPPKRGGDRSLILKRTEVQWIDRLKTLTPNGLNRDFDLHLFL
ncbi:hypothetical protein XELAEV_18013760mg [Xenopus laevis]|uniref:GIY-YIG domain-containing protein n=2 Tax=Xenopus laevis TaxID=8355 RepID=A0A974HZN6_XENLA|nr:hypothetical protein XELAEV_18013760mg [Xenopus laevis]